MPTWNSSLAVGETTIDAQHQELFQHADTLLDAMKSGKSASEVKPLLVFLDEYCARHFAHEEQLMRQLRYAGLDQHLAQHKSFVERFQTIVAQFGARGASATVTIALQQLVSGWLVQHIGATDKKLAAAVAAKRAAA